MKLLTAINGFVKTRYPIFPLNSKLAKRGAVTILIAEKAPQATVTIQASDPSNFNAFNMSHIRDAARYSKANCSICKKSISVKANRIHSDDVYGRRVKRRQQIRLFNKVLNDKVTTTVSKPRLEILRTIDIS